MCRGIYKPQERKKKSFVGQELPKTYWILFFSLCLIQDCCPGQGEHLQLLIGEGAASAGLGRCDGESLDNSRKGN